LYGFEFGAHFSRYFGYSSRTFFHDIGERKQIQVMRLTMANIKSRQSGPSRQEKPIFFRKE
jgi:hypothetical protein